jgi:hypothetical protein
MVGQRVPFVLSRHVQCLVDLIQDYSILRRPIPILAHLGIHWIVFTHATKCGSNVHRSVGSCISLRVVSRAGVVSQTSRPRCAVLRQAWTLPAGVGFAGAHQDGRDYLLKPIERKNLRVKPLVLAYTLRRAYRLPNDDGPFSAASRFPKSRAARYNCERVLFFLTIAHLPKLK